MQLSMPSKPWYGLLTSSSQVCFFHTKRQSWEPFQLPHPINMSFPRTKSYSWTTSSWGHSWNLFQHSECSWKPCGLCHPPVVLQKLVGPMHFVESNSFHLHQEGTHFGRLKRLSATKAFPLPPSVLSQKLTICLRLWLWISNAFNQSAGHILHTPLKQHTNVIKRWWQIPSQVFISVLNSGSLQMVPGRTY